MNGNNLPPRATFGMNNVRNVFFSLWLNLRDSLRAARSCIGRAWESLGECFARMVGQQTMDRMAGCPVYYVASPEGLRDFGVYQHGHEEEGARFHMMNEGETNSGSGETGSGETGSGETGSGETGSGETGSGETGCGETGSGETGSGGTGSGETGCGETGSGETGSGETGSGETGCGETGCGETGCGETGGDQQGEPNAEAMGV